MNVNIILNDINEDIKNGVLMTLAGAILKKIRKFTDGKPDDTEWLTTFEDDRPEAVFKRVIFGQDCDTRLFIIANPTDDVWESAQKLKILRTEFDRYNHLIDSTTITDILGAGIERKEE